MRTGPQRTVPIQAQTLMFALPKIQSAELPLARSPAVVHLPQRRTSEIWLSHLRIGRALLLWLLAGLPAGWHEPDALAMSRLQAGEAVYQNRPRSHPRTTARAAPRCAADSVAPDRRAAGR